MTVLKLQKLDAQGRPAGPVDVSVGVGTVWVSDEDDGALVDDFGEFTGFEPFTLNLTILEVNPAALYLITGSRRVFGWPRKLAINGGEYNRRRRRR
jgi:hypothetical protein